LTHGKVKSFTEKFGLSRARTKPVLEILLAQEWIHYHKAPEHAMIFTCDVCGTPRMFGRAFMIPDNVNPLLICHNCNQHIRGGSINQHYHHTFKGIFIGGDVRVPEMLRIQ
jgi:hypothetical protein